MRLCMSVLPLLTVLAVASPSLSRTWQVLPDGSGDAPTIQAGVDSAAVGDTVSVAHGTYADCTHVNPVGYLSCVIMKSGVCLLGDPDDPEAVVIDAQYAGNVIWCGFVDSSSLVQGLSFVHGASGWGGGACLAGSSLRISECVFRGNEGSEGGAVFASQSPACIDGCLFVGNSSSEGGAIYYGGGTGATTRIADCEFIANTAIKGGAIYYGYSNEVRLVQRCDFTGNSATFQGGAVYVSAMQNASTGIEDCNFTENSAPWGGAFVFLGEGVSASVGNCSFIENTATHGGAIWVDEHDVAIRDCLFLGNSALFEGGGISVREASVGIVRCTFCRNESPGGNAIIHFVGPYNHLMLFRTIVAMSSNAQAIYWSGGLPTGVSIQCVDLFGNGGGDWVGNIASYAGILGNFSAWPHFCDPEGDDFHLAADSPCLPENHPAGYSCGGFVGALGQGCGPVALTPQTWARVKGRYR